MLLNFVVFRTEPEKGEQSLRYNERSERPDWFSTARTLDTHARTHISRPSTTIVPGLVRHTANTQHTEGTYLNELLVEEMNREFVVVSNPVYWSCSRCRWSWSCRYCSSRQWNCSHCYCSSLGGWRCSWGQSIGQDREITRCMMLSKSKDIWSHKG